jgi:hypothetical protein
MLAAGDKPNFQICKIDHSVPFMFSGYCIHDIFRAKAVSRFSAYTKNA